MFCLMNTARCWLLFVAALLSLGAPPTLAQTPGATPMPHVPPALEAAIAESHEALRKILNGDPSGYAALFADSEDITLGNPFGPFGKGRAAVLAALNNAAKKYTDGSVRRVERVAVYGGGDAFVLVEIEHDRAKLGSSPDFADFAARVTSVYEKIGARWKLIHRHADPITTARPAESMLSGKVAASPIHSNAKGEANKTLVRAFLKALETGDVAAHAAMIDPAGKMHGLTGDRPFRVAQANIGEVCEMCAALPDRKIAIDLMVAESDLVAVRSTWSGTYSGDYRGMAIAKPIPVTVRYVNIYRIANGRIVENWASMDRQSLAEQLGYTLATPSSSSSKVELPKGIVGTWRLVTFEDVEDGKIIRRFGEKPNGLFVYTADGHVIIQIANPANPNCIAPSKKSGPGKKDDLALPVCSPDQMRTLLDGTVAYWGTYSVDAAAGEVIHHVTADLSNGYIATDQRRPFRLNGDRLVIGDGKTWTRMLERVRR